TRQGTYVMHFAGSGEEAPDKLPDGIGPQLLVILSVINMTGCVFAEDQTAAAGSTDNNDDGILRRSCRARDRIALIFSSFDSIMGVAASGDPRTSRCRPRRAVALNPQQHAVADCAAVAHSASTFRRCPPSGSRQARVGQAAARASHAASPKGV